MKLIVLTLLFVIPILGFSQENDSIAYKEPEALAASLSMFTPPEGFVPSEQFNGYIHYKIGAAIIMTLITETSYPLIAKGMTQEFFDENKLHYINESEVLTDNGTKGIKYKFSFTLEKHEYIRYMIYVGDLNQTLWLNITYPKLVDDLLEDELMKSIQGISLKATTNEKR